MDGRHSNDVALIKIRRKGDGSGIVFSDRVAPACLPMHDTPQKPGTECVISGWGKTDRKLPIDIDIDNFRFTMIVYLFQPTTTPPRQTALELPMSPS